MKLQHFALGERFEYNGRIFVKTGPLTAAAEEGGQQMIPRHAVLKPLTPPTAESSCQPAGSGHTRLSASAVRSAFERFYRVSEGLVAPAARPELEKARADFLATLG